MLDINSIIYFLMLVFGTASLLSGIFLVAGSFFRFRAQINYSMNMDLEVIRVEKIKKDDGMARSSEEGGGWKEEIGAMEQLLTTLAKIKREKSLLFRLFYDAPYVSLEIANPSDSEEIFFYMAVPKKYRESIEKQVHSFFPNASIQKVSDYTIFSPGGYTATAVLELKNSYALPIKTYEEMEVDPLSEISNSLSKFKTEEEGAALQLVIVPAKKNWEMKGRSIAHKMQQGKRLKDVHNNSAMKKFWLAIGKGLNEIMGVLTASGKQQENFTTRDEEMVQLTPEEQELIKNIERKSSKAGFRVNIRLLASSDTQERADEILSQMENAFAQFENPGVNYFQVKKRVRSKKVSYNYIFRNFEEKNAVVLSTEEIAGIFHFPISTTETPKIKWLKSGSAPPPVNIPKEGILLGYNDYRGVKTDIRLSDNDRRRHLYTIGQTGAGKSTFLQEMAKQDVRNGKGICFIDPHGDAVEDILTAIPKERAEDVIIFDPSDTERPLGLNMLEYEKPEEKSSVINEMISIFDKLYDLKQTGGPMFEQYARNAMLLVMEHPESGSTL
ncbi:MAG TPA: DUF87 domain-containing protein, partial [Candidatus Moranbacteria bacterium]|nr:DUF87 domain-containing protein [Candidatus Moranbacteria bacterium]